MFQDFSQKSFFKFIKLSVIGMLVIPFVISCSQQKEKEPENPSEESKDFTVKYDLVGNVEGNLVVYSQDFGKCIMEVRNGKKTISVIEDDEYYVISADPETKKGTKMLNPIYKAMLESLGAKTPKEFSLAVFENMGGKIVGEKTIAGNKCDVWELQEGMQKTCMTKDGIILETESTIQGVTQGKVATELVRGSTEGVDACNPGEDIEIEFVDIGQMIQQEGDTPQLELETEKSSEKPDVEKPQGENASETKDNNSEKENITENEKQ